MHRRIFTSAILVVLLTSMLTTIVYGQATNEKIQKLAIEGEELWNATHPDKGFMSEGNNIAYGLGYLKNNNFSSAIWYFEDVLNKNSQSPFGLYFLGLAKAGLKDYSQAEKYFTKAGELNSSLKGKANVLLVNNNQKSNDAAAINKPANNNSNNESNNNTEKLNQYKVGDKVEIMHAGDWWPGTVTKVEGSGRSVYVGVDYTFQNEKGSASYFYNGIRPATGKTATYVASKPGGEIVYGDYVLKMGLGLNQTQRGFFTLYSNGTYTYNSVKGTYSYNANTGVIVWKSGPFNDWGSNTSMYTRGKKVAGIDFTYHTNNGELYYQGAHNI
jgi:hypothetical protein